MDATPRGCEILTGVLPLHCLSVMSSKNAHASSVFRMKESWHIGSRMVLELTSNTHRESDIATIFLFHSMNIGLKGI